MTFSSHAAFSVVCAVAVWLCAAAPAQQTALDDSPASESSADASQPEPDSVATFQAEAIAAGKSAAAYWGLAPDDYKQWGTHSNRLVPVYTFGTAGGGAGIDLTSYIGANSVYRSEAGVRRLYGYVPDGTVNEAAQWLDQTNIADLQRAAVAAGRRYVFLVVFDGMDWQTTQAAAVFNQGKVTYTSGRGSGTRFQSYTAGGTSQFGFMVTSPHNDGTKTTSILRRLTTRAERFVGAIAPQPAVSFRGRWHRTWAT